MTDMKDECSIAKIMLMKDGWLVGLCAVNGIGYAPKNGNAFIEYCKGNAVPMELLLETGLVKNDEAGKFYSFFRERIMIPIRNRLGRIVAFIGRYIGLSYKPLKYLNSCNSEIYYKGTSLLGIDKSLQTEIFRYNSGRRKYRLSLISILRTQVTLTNHS